MPAPHAFGSFEIQSIELKKAALIFRAINHKLRQQLLELIHKRTRIRVTDIFVKLRLEQSVVSQHLAILRKADLVDTEREGKAIFYSINYDRLKQLERVVEELLKDK